MKRAFAPVLALGLLAGCVLKDDSMTFYLQPDGAVDVVQFSDDIRSSKEGLEGTKEEAEWLSDFTRGADETQARLKRTGAKEIKAALLKDRRPFAAAYGGSYGSMDQFAHFLDLNGKDKADTMAYLSDGNRRELRFHIEGSTQPAAGESPGPYPVFRFVPVQGTIQVASGFKVSSDSSSCTLDFASARDFYLAWKVRPRSP